MHQKNLNLKYNVFFKFILFEEPNLKPYDSAFIQPNVLANFLSFWTFCLSLSIQLD